LKILLSGHHNPHFETVTEYIERAICSLGHDLIPFEDRQYALPGRLRQRVPFLQRWDLQRINQRLIAIARESQADLTLVTGGHRILAETVQSLNDRGAVTALWTTDPPLEFGEILRAAPYYSHIFCQGTEANEIIAAKGVHRSAWLPMGCDPARHHAVSLTPEEKKRYSYDVVFVGSYYPERAALFEKLTDFDLAIWGPGWESLQAGSPLVKFIQGAHTTPDEWLKIYSASRIVLATHYRDPLGQIPVYQASPRVFEAMACGTFVLCDRQRDVLELFRDGEHLVFFSDGSDLVEKVCHYLEHPKERRTIARKGCEEVLANHTYAHRVGMLLDHVKGV